MPGSMLCKCDNSECDNTFYRNRGEATSNKHGKNYCSRECFYGYRREENRKLRESVKVARDG